MLPASAILPSALAMALIFGSASAAIKPAPPRKGLAPLKPPSPDASKKPEASAKPPLPKEEKSKPASSASVPSDPAKPSANILKGFSALETIHADPAKAREAISRCANLRNALAAYPAHAQKLHHFWGVALANSGDLDAATEKFTVASAATAPDQVLAVRALNAQASHFLRDPARVDRAVELVKTAVSRSKENSPEQLTARFHGACALYILGEPAKAAAALEPVETTLRGKSGNPEAETLKQNTANLLSAIGAEEAAKNPDNPPHVFYAPWRGPEIRFGLGTSRRIADLAFILRDFPRALALYTALEKEAVKRSQPEIQSWSRMQRGRLLSLTGKPEESEKLLSTFLSAPPYKDSSCAPFSVLRLALLYHNYLKDIPKAEKAFETAALRFRNTPEGWQCQYYRAMIPMLQKKPQDAMPLLVAYTKDHPDHPQTKYLTGHLIPTIEKQISSPAKSH